MVGERVGEKRRGAGHDYRQWPLDMLLRHGHGEGAWPLAVALAVLMVRGHGAWPWPVAKALGYGPRSWL